MYYKEYLFKGKKIRKTGPTEKNYIKYVLEFINGNNQSSEKQMEFAIKWVSEK